MISIGVGSPTSANILDSLKSIVYLEDDQSARDDERKKSIAQLSACRFLSRDESGSAGLSHSEITFDSMVEAEIETHM